MTKDQAEIVALWLGRTPDGYTYWEPRLRHHLFSGNGMVEILAKMRTEPEERRIAFFAAVAEKLPHRVTLLRARHVVAAIDELTPDLVLECAAEVLSNE